MVEPVAPAKRIVAMAGMKRAKKIRTGAKIIQLAVWAGAIVAKSR